jgi:hypothetical protein
MDIDPAQPSRSQCSRRKNLAEVGDHQKIPVPSAKLLHKVHGIDVLGLHDGQVKLVRHQAHWSRLDSSMFSLGAIRPRHHLHYLVLAVRQEFQRWHREWPVT